MAIRITAKKEVFRGEQKLRIASIHALGYDDLPNEYTSRGPNVRGEDGKRLLAYNDGRHQWTMYIDESLGREHFELRMEFVRRCGERLSVINKRLAAENASWCGELEVLI